MVPTSNKIHGPCIALKNELLPTTNTCHHVFPEFPFDVLLKVKHVIAVESFQISLLFFYLRSNLCQIDKLFMQEHLIYAHIYVDFCYYQQVPFFFFLVMGHASFSVGTYLALRPPSLNARVFFCTAKMLELWKYTWWSRGKEVASPNQWLHF